MSGTTWTKFYWSDWQSDPALRLCSYSARGLWMDMLCIAAAHDPIGYVAVAGRGLDETSIARMTGGLESEVGSLLGELERNGVFSRDRHGRIYSRRMTSDARKAAIARKNGKQGGNPSLTKDRENTPSDNRQDNTGVKPQEPEARSQKIVRFPEPSETIEPQQNGRAARRGTRLPEGWNGDPPGEAVIFAIREGLTEPEAFRVLEDFGDFWRAKSGADATKLDWMATWRRWLREEIRRRGKRTTATPQKRVSFV